MNEELVRDDVAAALDEIRRPAPALLSVSMDAIRHQRRRQHSPWPASAAAILLAIAIIGGLLAVGSLRRNTPVPGAAPNTAAQPALAGVNCALPVSTDQGPGLITFPMGTFTPARLPAVQATAYDPVLRTWFPTEPEGVSPDGRLVGVLDSSKGSNLTLRLVDSKGHTLYSRALVNRILGWAAGRLIFSTVDTDQLMSVSADGHTVTPLMGNGYSGSAWQFAANDSVWGAVSIAADSQLVLTVVRLDIASGVVTDWYSLNPSLENVSGGGPIFGLSPDGYPVVPDLTTDSRAGVLAIRAQGVGTPIYVANWRNGPSSFWPMHVESDSHGVWLTTTDGELYWSSSDRDLQLVKTTTGVHVLSFAGRCA